MGFLIDAEDVVQEAFIKCWKTYGKRESISPSLLFQTVKTTAIDYARSNGRRHKRENTHYEINTETAEWFQRPIEQEERHKELEGAIQQLSPDQQEVLVLKIWGELTFEQIGKTLNISPNTAASRYRYALGGLKQILTPTLSWIFHLKI